METGDSYIVEGNYWHDNFWGHCCCEKCESIFSHNMLGQILMGVREELLIAEETIGKNVMKKMDTFMFGIITASIIWTILIQVGSFWKCPYQDDDSANSYTLANLEIIQERVDYYNAIIAKINTAWALQFKTTEATPATWEPYRPFSIRNGWQYIGNGLSSSTMQFF